MFEQEAGVPSVSVRMLGRSRALRVVLVLLLSAAWVPAWRAASAVVGSAGSSSGRTYNTPFVDLGAVGPDAKMVLDVLDMRKMIVPASMPVLGSIPITPQAQAAMYRQLMGNRTITVRGHKTRVQAPIPYGISAPAAQPASQARTQTAYSGSSYRTPDGFDVRIAGQRNSPFYPSTIPDSGPGSVTTVLGGRCDGLPATQASIAPGNVVADRAGRIFWVDVGSSNNAQSDVYIRTIGTDGRVRTLGSLTGPIEGRAFKAIGTSESTDTRIVPDGNGGVFYTYNTPTDYGFSAGPAWQAEDVPIAPALIGHLRADGTDELVAGTRGAYGAPPLDGTFANATFDNIDAMTADAEGNLYVADSNTYGGDGGGYFYNGGSASATNHTWGVDQPEYGAYTVIRFVNRSRHSVTFFTGPSSTVTVLPGHVGTIAGSALQPNGPAIANPQPGDTPVTAQAARFPFVAGMVVTGHQVTLLQSEETYRTIGPITDPTGVVPDQQTVSITGLNFGGDTSTMFGTSVDSGDVAVLGGGAAGFVDDVPLKDARFNVRDHDGWFYGDLEPDGQGGLLVADTYNNRIRDIYSDGDVGTVAGQDIVQNYRPLQYPMGAVATRQGIVVSDWGDSRIIRDPVGLATVLAGNGHAGFCGLGAPASADLTDPGELAGSTRDRSSAYLTGADLGDANDAVTDSHGNTYVAIPTYGVVLRVAPNGVVSIAAGRPRSCEPVPPPYVGLMLGCSPPASGSGDGGSPQNAVLEYPANLAVDQFDNLYISDGDAVRYVNFGTHVMHPQGHTIAPGTIGTVYRHAVRRLHVRVTTSQQCGDFCNTFFDAIIGLGAITLDEKRGTLYVADLLDSQIQAVTYCGQSYLVAGKQASLLGSVTALLNSTITTSQAPVVDGTPAYSAAISPVSLAYDQRRDLLLFTDDTATAGSGTSAGRVFAVNVGNHDASIWGAPLAPRAIATYAGGSRCLVNPTCSYGDGSHAGEVAFEFPIGVDVAPNGSVFVTEDNRIRRVNPDGTVVTIAGNSRNMYDGTAWGSAALTWWFQGGECGDGEAATRACFAGITMAHLDSTGALIVTDNTSGRVRRILDAAIAPARTDLAPAKGAGWAFTAPQRLPNFGTEVTDPSLAIDSSGAVYVTGSMLTPRTAPLGLGILISATGAHTKAPCGVWNYTLDADGAGHDTPGYLGQPDKSWDQTSWSRSCSAALSPPGSTALSPPIGPDDRLLFAGGQQRGDVTPVVAGASRDGGRTFTTSGPTSTTTTLAGLDLHYPYPLALDGDTSGMTFTDSYDSVVDYALSHGGSQYVQLSRVFDGGFDDFIATRITSAPAGSGTTVVVPAFPTTVPGCIRLSDNSALCESFNQSSTTHVETVTSLDRGVQWAQPTTLFNRPCEDSFFEFAYNAYCIGYHGMLQVAEDKAGNDYAVWDENGHIQLSHSTDHGQSWSAPTQVDAGLPHVGYPAIVAGDAGRVAIAFYGTTVNHRDVATPDNQWWVYLAESTDATSSHPHFTQSVANNGSVHEGALCQTVWLVCGTTSSAGPAEAGNQIQVGLDPSSGHAIIAYTESRGIHDDGDTSGVVVTRQCTGPTMLVHVVARACTTTPDVQSNTGPVRCAPQGTDPTGDANWSGQEQPALDLTALGLGKVGDELEARVDVSSFSPVPPAGTGGESWAATWRQQGTTYFLRATSPAVGDPTTVADDVPPDTSAPSLSYEWGIVDGTGTFVSAGRATGHVDGSSIVMSVAAESVGNPQPATRLGVLRAQTAVLTNGTPDASTEGTWTTVDKLTTNNGYAVGLVCGSAGSASSSGPAARAAAQGHAGAPQPTPTILPTALPTTLPSAVPSLPPLLPPGAPTLPSCGIAPPPVPDVPPLPHAPRSHKHVLIVPPVPLLPRNNPFKAPPRAVAVHPPVQGNVEAQQPASQLVNQPAGMAQSQHDDQTQVAFAHADDRNSYGIEAAWMLAGATLTMGAGAFALRRRTAEQVQVARVNSSGSR